MNEERLKRILQAEQKAQALYESASLESIQIVERAEAFVKTFLEETRKQTEIDAKQIQENICSPQAIEAISKKSATMRQDRMVKANKNLPAAVDWVLEMLLGTNIEK